MGCRTLPKLKSRLENGSAGLEAPQQGQTNRLTRMSGSAGAAVEAWFDHIFSRRLDAPKAYKGMLGKQVSR